MADRRSSLSPGPTEADRRSSPSPGLTEADRRLYRRFGQGFLVAAALAVLLGLVLLALMGCSDDDDGASGRAGAGTTSASGRTPLEGFGEVAATVGPGSRPGSEDASVVETLCVLLASTVDQRAQGLMRVTDRSLGGYDGMLFEFPNEVSGTFWMRNTPMPVSIAFFDDAGRLVSTADMAPCGDSASCPTYAADGAYRYALEVPQGQLPAVGVTEGARLEVGGACEPVDD